MSTSVLDPIINETGKSYGINNADDLIKNATSGNRNLQANALEVFDALTNKIIQQNVTATTVLPGIYDLPNIFQGNRLIGNGKEYVHTYPQGNVYDWNREGYLPSHKDKTTGNIVPSRYDREPVAQIISDPIKKCVKMTITREELISRMVSIEKLEQLVAETINCFSKDMVLFLAHQCFSKIVSTNFSKTINDNSADCFTAWNNFGTHMIECETFRKDFVIDQTHFSKVGNTWLKDNKLIFMSPAVYAKYTMGLKPVVFNNKELALDKIINPANIYILPVVQYNNEYETESTAGEPEFIDTPYIDDQTIIILSKDSVAYQVQVEMFDRQYFANNTTDFYQKNLWYTLDVVGFTNGFKFISPNLTTLPQEIDDEKLITQVNNFKSKIANLTKQIQILENQITDRDNQIKTLKNKNKEYQQNVEKK